MVEPTPKSWLKNRAQAFCRRVGLKEGQTILDFGCNKGNYAIPAAEVVGPHGKVYALDKEPNALSELKRKLLRIGRRNVECLEVGEHDQIPLPARSVDAVLLYDVLHRGYFPGLQERKRLLVDVHRVLKPGGLLSFYVTHLRQYGMTFAKALDEVTSVGFDPRGQSYRRLVHDDQLVRGQVFAFTKRTRAKPC